MTKFLSQWTIKDLLDAESHFHLEYVDDEDTVVTVMQKMRTKKISSLPVRDSVTKKFIGIIDVLDMVTFCCTKYATVSLQAWDSYQQMETFAKTKCKYLLDISGRNTWRVMSQNRPLEDLVAVLANPHAHRVGVVNERHEVVGLISQSKLIQFLWKNRHRLETSLQNIIKSKVELWTHIHTQQVQTIPHTAAVYDAFYAIWQREVSGLAVVDLEGKLVANISASDIKRCRFYPIIGQMIKDLYTPIKDFLRIPESATDLKKKHHVPYYIHKSDSMEKVFELIVSEGIHRVFVIDSKMKPIAVISLCDILRRFLESSSH